jgi:hypothetical protein
MDDTGGGRGDGRGALKSSCRLSPTGSRSRDGMLEVPVVVAAGLVSASPLAKLGRKSP